MLRRDDRIRFSDHIALREIDGETMILTLSDTHLHTTNHVGECIYRCIEPGPTDVEAVVREVARRYGIDSDLISRDIVEFLEGLLAKGIVVEAEGGGSRAN